jgi:bile acid:Na+ symporter, BASS family
MTESFFSDQVLPIALFIIMFGIGITLQVKDFTEVFMQPKAILLGLSIQALLVPLLAFGLNELWPLSPAAKTGLVLIAACPGGSASNLLTHLLRGRVALSVSLTAINSLLVLITLPLVTNLALTLYLGRDAEIQLPFWRTFGEVLITVILPVGIGMLVRACLPRLSQRLSQPLRYLLPLILLGVFAGVLFFEDRGPEGQSNFWSLMLPCLAFNLLSALIGFLLPRWAGVEKDGQYTIAIEVSLRNSAIAIFVASSLLKLPAVALIAVVYSSFTFFSTALWAWLIKRLT